MIVRDTLNGGGVDCIVKFFRKFEFFSSNFSNGFVTVRCSISINSPIESLEKNNEMSDEWKPPSKLKCCLNKH